MEGKVVEVMLELKPGSLAPEPICNSCTSPYGLSLLNPVTALN